MNENSLIFMEKSGVFSKKSADRTDSRHSGAGYSAAGCFPINSALKSAA